jgi:hypothetical protein
VHKDPSIATHNLQLACDSIGKWLATKKLFFNAAQTVFVIFSLKQITWANLFVLIDGTKIFPSHSASFLGLFLDTKLNWANHIQAKCVSAKRAMMAVFGSRLVLIVNAYVFYIPTLLNSSLPMVARSGCPF